MDDARVIGAIAGAVLANEPPAAPVFTGEPERATAALAIYRNNVRSTLARALSDSFPVVEALVGEKFFKATAREYFHAHPPSSPMIIDYARRFPEFVAQFPPAASLAYLADVARLEWAWLKAYRAADVTTLTSDAVIAAGGDDPSRLRFEFHPSLRLLSSRYPAASIWKRNRPGGGETPVNMDIAEDILIARPERTVELCILKPGASVALSALQGGASVADAFGCAIAETPDFNPQELFTLILSTGIVVRATTNELRGN